VAAGKAGVGAARPGGRTERNRRAVAAAALALLRRGRIDLSPSLVADEAGVGRSTVHRRWPTRAELLREALRLHTRTLRVPDTGALDADLRALARALARFLSDPTEIALTSAMAVHSDPDLSAWQVEHYGALARELALPFRRAAGRGELAAGADPALLFELLIAPMVVRTAVMKQALDRRFVAALAEQVLRAARGSGPARDAGSKRGAPRRRRVKDAG
jgi:AcrR family transcriptional regulator